MQGDVVESRESKGASQVETTTPNCNLSSFLSLHALNRTIVGNAIDP